MFGIRQRRIAPREKAIFIDEAWELIGDDDTNNPNNTKALAGEWVQEIFKMHSLATAVRPLLPPRILAAVPSKPVRQRYLKCCKDQNHFELGK